MGQFVHVTLISHRGLMTIYFKSRTSGRNLLHKLGKLAKIGKFEYFRYDCYQIHFQVGYMGQFIHIYVIHCMDITHRHHDHLFPKLWHLGAS